jgi:hypothetical protein
VRSILLIALAAGLSAIPLRAQEADTTRRRERPFVEGGVYDKPYLTRLLGRTAIGGYAEAHARFARVDGATEEAGFEAKRWNIFASTAISDFVRLGAEVEFEDGGREIKLEYAAVDIALHRSLTFRAGMLLSPLGRFNLAHDSPQNEFTDRPLVSTELIGTALSEPGLGFFGLFPFGREGRLTYELYAVNGFHEGLLMESADGIRIPEGRGNFEDNNRSPAMVGRVAYSPGLELEVGLSAHHGAYNVFEEEGLELDERRDLTIWAVDFDASLAGLRLAGEAAFAAVELPPSLEGLFARRQRGLYVEVLRDFGAGWVRTMPRSYFSVGARLDVMDFDSELAGDLERRVTLGLNFRPTQDTAVKLNYVRGVERDRFNNAAEMAGILFSVATYF